MNVIQEQALFADADISKEVLQALDRMNMTAMTTIQSQTIPVMMDGHDIIAVAPTGTGKTFAFGIPMLEYVSLQDRRIQEVVLAPTRELAQQIAEELRKLAYYIKNLRIAVLYGGQNMSRQIDKLKESPQIVVATPGRLLDMMQRKIVSLANVHTLVLDEADEMLNMGFIRDVCRIIEAVPRERQFVMFSATTNQDVQTISWKYQHDPVNIVVRAENENKPSIRQYVIQTDAKDKFDQLTYLLDSDQYGRVMVFTNTKFTARNVTNRLIKEGYDADTINGDVPQARRTAVMNRYKKGKLPVLVCTDVAARGIDVDDVELIVNYDLPMENEFYLHRIGRTGRAKRHGIAISLVSFQDSVRLDEIRKYMQADPEKLSLDRNGVLCDANGEAFFDNV